MPSCHAVFVTATGELKSQGPVAGALPAGWSCTPIDHEINGEIEEWDPASRTVKLRGWSKKKTVIVCKHAGGAVDTLFDAGEPITIEVEVRLVDNSARDLTFNGTFRPMFRGPRGLMPVKLVFASGFVSKVITLNDPGTYSIGPYASQLVHVPDFSITVSL